MKKSILAIVICLTSLQVFAQFSGTVAEPELARVFIGPGLGLDYGGLGLDVMAMPSNYVGLFVGVGYNLVGVGFNGGLRAYVAKSSARVRPYFSGMYGYHTVIKVQNAEQYNKIFYGTTVGFGLDVMSQRNERNYWTFGIHVPIQGSEVDDYIDSLRPKGIEFKNQVLPIRITLGFRFGVGNEY